MQQYYQDQKLMRENYYVPASELAAVPQYGNSCFIDQWNRKCAFLSPYATGGRLNVICSEPLPPVRFKGITNTLCALESKYKLHPQDDPYRL